MSVELGEDHRLVVAILTKLVEDRLEAIELAVKRETSDASEKALDADRLLGSECFALLCSYIVCIQDLIDRLVVRHVLICSLQAVKGAGFKGFEPGFQGASKSAKAAGEPTAVNRHHESHRVPYLGASLVVDAANVVLNSFIERSLVWGQFEEVILDSSVGDRRGQKALFEVPSQKSARVSRNQSANWGVCQHNLER